VNVGAGEEKFDSLYACLRTPIVLGEPEPEIPFTLPAGVEPAPRSFLLKQPDFEIPKISFTGTTGFLAASAGVGLLIGIFFWILILQRSLTL
jgi:hypothetical protein